ncbi:hypothetical protein EV286_11171 [Rhizobium sp. BK251]|nr:hypothetical protein EV286_11171 [Rhizobium sp. BK251]
MPFPWKECGLGELRPAHAKILQSVYDRASVALPNHPETQCELARFILRMDARGLHNEDALYDLCIVSLRRQRGAFGVSTLYFRKGVNAALAHGRALLKR